MNDIDFLPNRYRERAAQHRARLWRGLMLCCLAGFVALIAFAQLALRRPIERQLLVVNAQYPAAVVTTTRAEQLQKDLVEIEGFAALYTYLRHPWPVTQLLNTLTEPLSDTMVINEIHLERKPNGLLTATPAPGQPATPPANPAEAAKRDLDRLRASYDVLIPTVHVTGVTTDASKLQGYVSRLAPSPLFKSAKIETLQAVTSDAGLTGSRFELQLQLRPGFGQPEGPREPLLESASTLAARTTPAESKP